MALVLVLSVVVIVTILVVAFLSISSLERSATRNYVEGQKADELARGGLSRVVGDFRHEMLAGSTTNAWGAYLPVTNLAMVPARIGTDASLTNLIRRSVASDPFYTSPPAYFNRARLPTNRASSVSSTNASANGRFISAGAWAMPQLVDTNSAAAFGAFTNRLPDWIFVTRAGPRALADADVAAAAIATSTNDFVVGRYAYNVYDVGGLLDANLAGSPAAGANLTASEIASKGSQAFADLPALGLTSAQVADLVAWRNTATGTNFSKYVFQDGPASGFLRGQPGDRAFFGRADFLRYARVNGWASPAIQNFTVFSADTAAPSWSPKWNASDLGGTDAEPDSPVSPAESYAYRDNKDLSTSRNRDLRGVCVTAPFTRWDGREAKVGEPLIKSRFDLNWLAWITSNGPSASNGGDPMGTDANIKQRFGLVWDNSPVSWTAGPGETGKMWIYTGPNGSTASPPNRIRTLAQVAAEAREPDFFELLQTGMLRGSLGLYGGQGEEDSTNVYGEWYRYINRASLVLGSARYVPHLQVDRDGNLVSQVEDYQILRAGACMMDQADADGLPTVIRFNDENLIGVENLPGIAAVGHFAIRPPPGNSIAPNANQQFVHQWMNFGLWNPHQNAGSPPAGTPTDFRIVVRSGNVTPKVLNRGPVILSPESLYAFGTNFQTVPASIQFSIADYPNKFAEQTRVGDTPSVVVSNTNSKVSVGTWSNLGIHIGYDDFPENRELVPKCSGVPREPALYKNTLGITSPRQMSWKVTIPLNIELQYKGSSGTWRTYDAIYSYVPARYEGNDPHILPTDPDYATVLGGVAAGNLFLRWQKSLAADPEKIGAMYAKPDPRTLRMNMALANMNNLNLPFRPNPSQPYTPSSQGVFQAAFSGMKGSHFTYAYVNGQVHPQFYADNFLDVQPVPPSLNSGANYTDRDFVKRWGDAGGRAAAHPAVAGNAAARPVILNRPFRNVGELGYVFRDTPWRTLDLLSSKSADAALLDLFSVGTAPGNEHAVVAGRVNVNAASQPVLAALISGAAIKHTSSGAVSSTVSTASANSLAADFVAARASVGPVESLAQLPILFLTSSTNNTVSTAYPAPKSEREAAVRALSSAGTVRTWNLLVDIVAQSGRFPLSATSRNQFVVQGQRRYWMHLAIDRFTGTVVSTRLEPVNQ